MSHLLTLLLVLPLLLYVLRKILLHGSNQANQNLKSVDCNRWKNIPKISALTIVSTMQNLSNAHVRLYNLFKKEGKIFKLQYLSEECVFLNDPVLGQKLLASKVLGHMSKPAVFLGHLHEMLGNGMVTSQGEYWQAQRKLLSKAFTHSALRRYCKIYSKCSRQLIPDLEKMFNVNNGSQYHQISAILHNCSINIIMETVMGLDSTKDDVQAGLIHESFNNLRDIGIQRNRNAIFLFLNLIWKLHPLSWEFTRNIKIVDGVVKSLIDKHRNNCEEKQQHFATNAATTDKEEGDGMHFECILELLYKIGLNEKQIIEETRTLIWAGYETTSATMHYLLFLLALNKSHQEACRQEVDRIFADPSYCQNGELSMNGLLEMKYLERCILETLRTFPVADLIMRQLESPLKIDETLEIPGGTSVALPLGFFHKMEEYFPNPETFDPDRFLNGNSVNRSPLGFVPFSAGPRICIGKILLYLQATGISGCASGLKYAMLEVKTVVAHILREFEVHTSDKFKDIPIIPSVVSFPERDYYFYLKKHNVNTL